MVRVSEGWCSHKHSGSYIRISNMAEETQIAKKPASIKELIGGELFKQQLALALPRHMTPDRFVRIALTALQRTPKLQECTQTSLFKCLLDLGAMGIEADGRRAHLIPYGSECTLILDYKGIVDLVRRDPNVLDVQCITIRANDKAEWSNGTMDHSIDPKSERGEVLCTYTRIAWKNGTVSIGEPFSKADAEHTKKSSKTSSSGPWKDHYVEMWKKSNIKRDSKMWPLSPEIREHLEKDADVAIERDITPVPQASLKLPSQEVEAVQS